MSRGIYKKIAVFSDFSVYIAKEKLHGPEPYSLSNIKESI
jgi:hypothetical protein